MKEKSFTEQNNGDDALIFTIDNVRARPSTQEVILHLAVPIEKAELVTRFFTRIGKQVAAAFVDIEAGGKVASHAATEPASELPAEAEGDYGAQARELRLSSFFRRPEVWRAVGTDTQFLAWLKTRKCAARATATPCHGDIVPAHVRRIANGAGAGSKPEFSAISLCDYHHRRQHQHGESAIADKEWWDKQRIDSLVAWCWETLKTQLGYEHWNQVPPNILISWAENNGVDKYLPEEYRPDGISLL